MEEALMSLYHQYKEMESPEEDPLRIEDEERRKRRILLVEVEAPEPEECVSKELERAALEEIKEWPMEMLTVASPLSSRTSKEVVEGLSWVYSKFKSLHIPSQRLHADRAREFVTKEVKRWAQARDLHQTFTEGDSGGATGRAEREVGIVKALTRAQLVASGEDRTSPCFRTSSTATTAATGCAPAPALSPFGTMAYAKGRDGKEERGRSRIAGLYEERKNHGPSFISVF
eukprot:s2087_g6.t1